MIELTISNSELYKLQLIVAVGAGISIISGFAPLLFTQFDILDVSVMSIQTQYVTWLVILLYIVRAVFSSKGGLLNIIIELMVVWEAIFLIAYPFYWNNDDTALMQFIGIFIVFAWRIYKWKQDQTKSL